MIANFLYYLKWLQTSGGLTLEQKSQVPSTALNGKKNLVYSIDYRLVDCLGCPFLAPEPTPERPQYDVGITVRVIIGAVLDVIGGFLIIYSQKKGKR